MSPLLSLLVWIGLPFLAALMLSYLVRRPEFLRRILLVVFAITFCVWALFPLNQAFHLGIDLRGGTILLYQVKQPLPEDFSLDKMVSAIQRRINPIGMVDVTVRGVGQDRIELVIPEATPEEVNRTKRLLTELGTLEFRILANMRDHRSLIDLAEESYPQPVIRDGQVMARWVPIASEAAGQFASPDGGIVVRSDPGQPRMVLVVHDQQQVTGEFLRRVSHARDDWGGPAVGFRFNAEGAHRFAALTAANSPDSDGFERRLAIILNGQVQSAPSVRGEIHDQGIITGQFTSQEVDDLVSVLNAGSLPGDLQQEPISQVSVGPTLGKDTIASGLWSIGLASAAVFLFMLVYYRLAGLIADLAVLLNVTLVVAVMAWIDASFTLPGLAGLALTIGMAVDANVLIFERLREEQQQGRTLRVALRHAFERALRPILDANITTLLTGIMLYTIGTEQIRGFALTLVLGLVANLFTAILVCRLLFDLLERSGWVQRIGMFSLLGQSNRDFMKWRRLAVTGSCVLILLGLGAAVMRGRDLLDIDFTGGTLAAVRLSRAAEIGEVRQLLDTRLPDARVEQLQLRGQPDGTHYLIRTTRQDQQEVRTLIGESLGDLIARPKLTAGSLVSLDESAPGARTASEATVATLQPPAFRQGYAVPLMFNMPISDSQLRGVLEEQMTRHGVRNAPQHYLLTQVVEADGPAQAEEGLVQATVVMDQPRDVVEQVISEAGRQLASTPMLERLDNFGAQVAGEARIMAGLAMLAGMGVIVVYLWIRFQNVLFGVGAIVAVLHDVLFVFGCVAASHWLAATPVGKGLQLEAFRIDLPMIAAFLTLIGYSVNDTIVVYDRIRETRRRGEPITWFLLNRSINQTLSRTLLTGLTTWLVATILYAIGGQGIHGFAFCLVIGVLVGTFSSLFIASPMLIWISQWTRPRAPGGPSQTSQGDEESAPEIHLLQIDTSGKRRSA